MWGSLTTKERLARRTLLGLILTTGRGPGLKALASRLDVSESVAAKLLAALERKGFLVRDQRSNTIKAAYPLSIRPTNHRVTLKDKGQRRYALCAIDALGVGPLFGVAVIVNATCPHCGRSIRIQIEESQIVAVKPAGVVVWYGLPELLTKQEPTLNLAETHCPLTNFFCTEEDAHRWSTKHGKSEGKVLLLSEAWARALELFGQF